MISELNKSKREMGRGFRRAFTRPCKRCDKKYLPSSKFTKYCDNCRNKMRIQATRKRVSTGYTLTKMLRELERMEKANI